MILYYILDYRKEERKNIIKMGCAQGFTFSVGFIIILLAHLVSIMTHIALGNDLIVSKVSYSANNVVYGHLFLLS